MLPVDLSRNQLSASQECTISAGCAAGGIPIRSSGAPVGPQSDSFNNAVIAAGVVGVSKYAYCRTHIPEGSLQGLMRVPAGGFQALPKGPAALVACTWAAIGGLSAFMLTSHLENKKP